MDILALQNYTPQNRVGLAVFCTEPALIKGRQLAGDRLDWWGDESVAPFA